MKKSAVLIFFLGLMLLAAFFTSCSSNTEVWRGHTSDGTTVLVEITKGYTSGNEVLVYRHDFVDVNPLVNTKVTLDSIVQ